MSGDVEVDTLGVERGQGFCERVVRVHFFNLSGWRLFWRYLGMVVLLLEWK